MQIKKSKFIISEMKDQVRTSATHPIEINFVKHSWSNGSQLGITFAPGKKQPNAMTGIWHRDLDIDLQRIRHHFKIGALVCLLEDHQMHRVQIPHEIPTCKSKGIKPYHFPVEDDNIPENEEQYKALIKNVVDQHLRKGQNVVVHCLGGIGRAPTFAAACLIYSGLDAKSAIENVKASRHHSLTVPCQVAFLNKLKFN